MFAKPSTEQPGASTDKSVEAVQELLIAQYGSPESDFALRDSLRRLERAFGDLANVRGKRVLDLGCGAARGTAEVNANRGTWEPWLPRAVVELGGEAVGLDIGMVRPDEQFEFHRVDLREPDSLSFLEKQSFDAINCSNLFSSPHLVLRLGEERDSRQAFQEQLLQQAKIFLKPDGMMIEFDTELDNW